MPDQLDSLPKTPSPLDAFLDEFAAAKGSTAGKSPVDAFLDEFAITPAVPGTDKLAQPGVPSLRPAVEPVAVPGVLSTIGSEIGKVFTTSLPQAVHNILGTGQDASTFAGIYDGAVEGARQIIEKALGEPSAVTARNFPGPATLATLATKAGRALPEIADTLMTPLGVGGGALAKTLPPAAAAAVPAAFAASMYEPAKIAVGKAMDDPTPANIGEAMKYALLMGVPAAVVKIARTPKALAEAIDRHNIEAARLVEGERKAGMIPPLEGGPEAGGTPLEFRKGEYDLGTTILDKPIPVTVNGKPATITNLAASQKGRPNYQVVDATGKPLFAGNGAEVQTWLRSQEAAPAAAEAAPPVAPAPAPTPAAVEAPAPEAAAPFKKGVQFEVADKKYEVIGQKDGRVSFTREDAAGRKVPGSLTVEAFTKMVQPPPANGTKETAEEIPTYPESIIGRTAWAETVGPEKAKADALDAFFAEAEIPPAKEPEAEAKGEAAEASKPAPAPVEMPAPVTPIMIGQNAGGTMEVRPVKNPKAPATVLDFKAPEKPKTAEEEPSRERFDAGDAVTWEGKTGKVRENADGLLVVMPDGEDTPVFMGERDPRLSKVDTKAAEPVPAANASASEKPYNPNRDLKRMDKDLHAKAMEKLGATPKPTTGPGVWRDPMSGWRTSIESMKPADLSPDDRATLHEFLGTPEDERITNREDMVRLEPKAPAAPVATEAEPEQGDAAETPEPKTVPAAIEAAKDGLRKLFAERTEAARQFRDLAAQGRTADGAANKLHGKKTKEAQARYDRLAQQYMEAVNAIGRDFGQDVANDMAEMPQRELDERQFEEYKQGILKSEEPAEEDYQKTLAAIRRRQTHAPAERKLEVDENNLSTFDPAIRGRELDAVLKKLVGDGVFGFGKKQGRFDILKVPKDERDHWQVVQEHLRTHPHGKIDRHTLSYGLHITDDHESLLDRLKTEGWISDDGTVLKRPEGTNFEWVRKPAGKHKEKAEVLIERGPEWYTYRNYHGVHTVRSEGFGEFGVTSETYPTREEALKAALEKQVEFGQRAQAYHPHEKGKQIAGGKAIEEWARGELAKLGGTRAAPAKKPKAKHDYSSTQVNLPETIAKRVRQAAARIPEKQLGEKGRETEPHITVRYGLHGRNAEEVRKLLSGEGPIQARLGKASLFQNEDENVLKVDVESPDLDRLNAKLAALPHTDTHAGGYKPHVTIAYLKPGEGERYAGKPVPGVSGQSAKFDRVVFSSSDGAKEEISLTRKAAALPKPAPKRKEEAKPEAAASVEPDIRTHVLKAIEGKAGGASISEIRASLPGADKVEFDRTVLDLYKGGEVYLDRHDHPAALTDSERAELVSDRAGNYYIGITEREPTPEKQPEVETAAAKAPIIEEGKSDGRADRTPEHAGAEDPRALAQAPPADVPAPAEAGHADAKHQGGGASDERPSDRRNSEGSDVRSGSRSGVPGVVPASGRRGSAEPRLRSRQPAQSGNDRDYRITDADQIGVGGKKQKAKDNLEAIRTLKAIEKESRAATAEEKKILAKYVGWGGMAQDVFGYNRDYSGIREDLRELLTPEEYEAARKSTLNAHYTSPKVVKAMWAAMQRLGVEAEMRVLEPSMGVGYFFGLQPEGLMPSMRTGIELDPTTGGIAKLLYPDSAVNVAGFQEVRTPNNFYDLAIGNVPFGKYGVADPQFKRNPLLTRSIHDYFFAKALEKVRPGGIVAFLTSRYTMDKQDSAFREYVGSKADLVAAIRFPETTHRENAGTDVVTDLIILQKREESTAPSGEQWITAPKTKIGKAEVAINTYFQNHPEMVLGKHSVGQGMYSNETLTVEGDLTPELLDAAIAGLPEGIVRRAAAEQAPEAVAIAEMGGDGNSIKDGGYGYGPEGRLMRRGGDILEPAGLSADATERVKGMLRVRDTVRDVFRTQLQNSEEKEQVAARKSLNREYDAFVKQHGYVSTKENIRAMSGDPDLPLLLSLELWDAETKTAKKADVFTKRTIAQYVPVDKVDDAAGALAVSLAESGRINWTRMQELTGQDPEDLQEELKGVIYRNPEGGRWQTADEYLSGNVRQKLGIAREAARTDERFEENVKALEAVQPKDLQPHEITARLGSSWIPTDVIRQFAQKLFEIPGYIRGSIKVNYAPALGSWTIEIPGGSYAAASSLKWGTERYPGTQLLDDALNLRVPKVYDRYDDTSVLNQQETAAAQEKFQILKDHFREWAWKDVDRAKALAKKYNDEFNAFRLRTFDGSHLKFPGMARGTLRGGDLMAHQKNAVWRVLQNGNTLLAHVVGAGKTFEITAAIMELRRMGLAKKPMVVVPNHLVEQWGAEFLRLYPTANVFVAGKEHFATGKRQQAISRIATGNYDAVIVSFKSFEKIPVSDGLFEKYVRDQIAELRAAVIEIEAEEGSNRDGKGKSKNKTVKQLEAAALRLEQKLENRRNREGQDNTLTFEELGVDHLFVDEAHNFKNLFFTTKMPPVAGLPRSESNRAFDMYLKTQYVSKRNNGRGLVFATGTPISNTLAEMYTMQRYLQGDFMKEQGIAHFDAWAANFAEAVTALELAPEGGTYRMNTRFTKFVNLPELATQFRMVADVQTADMLKLPVPKLAGGRVQAVTAPETKELKDLITQLGQRADEVRRGAVHPRIDNMLKITSEGRKAALDLRLISPDMPDYPDSKVNRAVDRIFQIWDENKATRRTQLFFCDLSTPKAPGEGFSVYDDIRQKLIKRGVPKKEIAFIHDYNTDEEKLELFNAVNAGRITVLGGSTEKMGAGTNVQKRLIALHHLDAPWRPSDIEQREGRIRRQGNENDTVQIYQYLTQGSFDAYMWQTLENKAGFIAQAMKGDISLREVEDVGTFTLSAEEFKAVASGNPLIREKVGVDAEVRKLDMLRAAWEAEQYSIRSRLRNVGDAIPWQKNRIAAYKADLARRNDDYYVIGDRKLDREQDGSRKAAGEALAVAMMMRAGVRTSEVVGTFRGFSLETDPRYVYSDQKIPDLMVAGDANYPVSLNMDSPTGTLASIEAAIRNIEGVVANAEEDLRAKEQQLESITAELGKPFAKAERLNELLKKQKEINAALGVGKAEAGAGLAEEATASPAAEESEGGKEISERRRKNQAGFISLGRIPNEPLTDYSALGAVKTKLVRNLSQLEKASPAVHTAAIRAASSRAQAVTILRAALPQIEKALAGGDHSWDELRLALVESRLRGIRDRWLDFADQVSNMTADDLEGAFNDRFVTLLDAIDGKSGIAQDTAQTAAALAAVKDWENLGKFLMATFKDAAAAVANAMDPVWYDDVTTDPKVQEALGVYKRLVEKAIADNHQLNEGVFSSALGPLNTYYPLVPLGKKQPLPVKRVTGYKKPKNIANQFATGITDGGFDAGMEALNRRMAHAINNNDKAALIQALMDEGWMLPVGRSWIPPAAAAKGGRPTIPFQGPDGQEYTGVVIERAPSRLLVMGKNVTPVPASYGIVPEWLERELRPILEPSRAMTPGLGKKIIAAINWFSLAGPADAVFHTSNLLGTLVANTPFLEGNKLLSAPVVKRLTAIAQVIQIDPTSEEAARDLVEMSKLGLVPEKYGTVTYSKQLAAQLGAERKPPFVFAPLLYGPSGIDIRARLLMYRLAKAVNPEATPQQLYLFVNQLGNYTPALAGEVERAVKSTGFAPFYTAGSTMLRNGINAWTGGGPMPKEGIEHRIWQQLTGGAITLLALWAVTYHALTGKWPWEDKRAKLLEIPVGGGRGPIDHYRHSQIGHALWGPGDDVGYLNFGFFNPLVKRGGRVLGAPGAFEAKVLGGSNGQAIEAAQRDMMNSLAHPIMGPIPRAAFVGLTGAEPYLTGLRDMRGRVAPQFYPAIPPKTAPGLPALTARALHAAAEINAFYGSLGEATGLVAPEADKGNRALRMVVDLTLPGAIGRASNPWKKMTILGNQRKGTR